MTDDELWQCDGCPLIGTEAEIKTHVTENGTLTDGRMKAPEDITCWGGLRVGSPAWESFVFDGVHPMDAIGAAIHRAMEKYSFPQVPEE